MPRGCLNKIWRCGIAGLAAALLVVPTSWLVLRFEDAEQAASQRVGIVERLGTVRSGIESALGARLGLLQALCAFVASQPELTQDAFALFARDLVGDTATIRSLQLARDNVVSHVYPPQTAARTLGLRLPGDLPAQQVASVDLLLATGRPVLLGPVRLLQGGTGFIARARVLVPGDGPGAPRQPWGLATVILDTRALFREAHLSETRDVRLAIRAQTPGQGRQDMVFGDPAIFQADPVIANVPVPGGNWQLAAVPGGGWTGAAKREVLLGYAGASWLALTLSFWAFLSWPVRLAKAVATATYELARTRDSLEYQVAERTRALRAANEAVRQSEAELRGLRDHAPLGIFSATASGCYLTVNAQLARMYGFATPGTMLENVANFREQHFFAPEEHEAMLSRLDADGMFSDYEVRRRTHNGEAVWMSLSMRALRDVSGEVIRYEGFCLDITERKRAETVLADQERELRVIFENSPLGLVYFDATGRVVKCNARFLVQMQTQSERVEGKNLLPLLPPFVREALLRAQAGQPAQGEGYYRSVTGDGSLFARMIFNPVDPGRPASAVIATVEDTSADREKDAALRLLRAAVEASPVSIVITDAMGAIEYVNPRFSELTGYDAADVRGHNPRVLQSGIHTEAFYREMWTTITDGLVWRGQFCNRKKNGELYWEDASISPIRDEDGVISHFVAVKEDITKRKKLEAVREDVERIMRHDLKAPLNSIINLPGFVAERGGLDQEQRDLLAMIERAGRNMLDQINQSLDLYKMEAGVYVPLRQPVDLLLVTDGVTALLSGLSRAKGVTVQVSAAGDAPHVLALADAGLCHTIFCNLLKNAIEASSEGQLVSVRLAGNGRADWSVHNPRPVPEAIVPVFFEKYITSGKSDGNGLGTYSARLMTECQGGCIRLETDAANGTTVTVILPAPARAADAADGAP